jgi:hypothetical protein
MAGAICCRKGTSGRTNLDEASRLPRSPRLPLRTRPARLPRSPPRRPAARPRRCQGGRTWSTPAQSPASNSVRRDHGHLHIYAEPQNRPRHFYSIRTSIGSPLVVEWEIFYAESDCRRGCIRGFRMGFIRGITLDDHPVRLRKPQLIGDAWGSAGVPDSLGHKQGVTSGGRRGLLSSHSMRVGNHPFFTFTRPHLPYLSILFREIIRSLRHFRALRALFYLSCAPAPRRPTQRRVADLRKRTVARKATSRAPPNGKAVFTRKES